MRTIAMIKRVFKEMLRDKRTLVLMFLGPLLILSMVYALFQTTGETTATLGLRHVDSTLVQAVKNKHLKLHQVTSTASAEKIIRQHDYAGLLTQKGDRLTLTLANSDQTATALLKQSLQQAQIKLKTQAAATAIKQEAAAISQLQAALARATKAAGRTSPAGGATTDKTATNYSFTTQYLYGSKNSTYFDTLLPIMMGFVVFFFVFLISGIALLRERTTGTLYRLLATPVRRGEIIGGYLAGYGTFAVIQTLLIVTFTIYVFKVQIIGSMWQILLINLLLAAVALTMGLFISTFADSEFQMMQFIPIVAIPQIFFSGIVPLATMPTWLQVLAHLFPLYYGAGAMTNVIQKGVGFNTIAPDLGILLLFALFFLFLNVQTMKRYRQV